MNRKDRLRLIDFQNESVNNAIRGCLNDTYDNQDISTREGGGAFEFKLPGEPFHCIGDEAVNTRICMVKMLVGIIEFLLQMSFGNILFSSSGDVDIPWVACVHRYRRVRKAQ